MANRFPIVAIPGQVNTVGELPSGDNLDLTASNIVVDTDKVLTLPQVTTTLVGRDTSDSLSNKVLVAPKFADTTGDHYYQIAVNELDGTRTLSLPLLTGNDEFVFKDHTQTLTNKTLTNPTINAGGGTLVLPQGTTASQTAEGQIFWDSDDDLLSIGTGSARKVFVDTNSTQTISGKTADGLSLTGTLTAGGSPGSNGFVLKSTGTGVQWVASSEAIEIGNDTSTNEIYYPLLSATTSGSFIDVDVSSSKLQYNPSTGTLFVTRIATTAFVKDSLTGNELLFSPKYNVQVETGDGTTAVFTLNNSVTNEQELLITVGGVPQTPGANFSYEASGTTLTFHEAPNPDDRIVIRYLIYKVR
jgi:hypothetical protein